MCPPDGIKPRLVFPLPKGQSSCSPDLGATLLFPRCPSVGAFCLHNPQTPHPHSHPRSSFGGCSCSAASGSRGLAERGEPCAGANAGGGESRPGRVLPRRHHRDLPAWATAGVAWATAAVALTSQGAADCLHRVGFLSRWCRGEARQRGDATWERRQERGVVPPEACVPRPEPGRLARPRPRPRRVCGTGQVALLFACRRPAGPRCHQAQGCSPRAPHSPAARTARALPLNGCLGAGPTRPVLGGARPPAKATGGRRPSGSRERPSLERHCQGIAVLA